MDVFVERLQVRLYCTKCRRWADKRHKYVGGNVIEAVEEVLEAVDALLDLGIRVSKGTCSITPRKGRWKGKIQATITIMISLREPYPASLFSDLPEGWRYWTEADVGFPIQQLIYMQTDYWLSVDAMPQRIKEVAVGFAEWLRTSKDKTGLAAVMTFLCS